ncbi:uncharacterized protein LOC119103328 [Pollicipes pollicipes]|uniref:uncharacterized protein LOC119103328 n=1 Tax=Pollicipes pollicipes TaxID=41117 RepID=UPI001884A545|nr:uncharacterized protein LOC119103328 [Pollicipes pollicipes]
MPELRPDRRSPSPVAPVSATSASDISRQMAGTDASTASTALRASPPTLAERERPSLFSPVKPLAQTEGESVDIGSSGGASTSGSSLSNLTSTLTREGQTLPAVAASLHELTAGLRGLSDRVATLADGLESSHAELAVTRADVAAVQGSVTSLQTLAASLNNRMVAFSGMFRKVDEQLLDMWSEMDTVNNNVHHVMHKALEYQEQNERMSAQLEEMRAELLAAFPERLLGMPRSATTRTPPRSQARSRSRRDRHDSEQLCEIDDLVVEPATEPPGDGAQVTPCDDTSQ